MFDNNWKLNVTSKYRYESTGIKDFVINHLQQNNITNPIIVDVGCSYGIALEWIMSFDNLSRFNPYTIGIDSSKKVRKKAEKVFDEFVNEEVQKVSGRENIADIVICHKAAIFVIGTRRVEIIKKCASFLKKDGILITDVDCYPPRTVFTNTFRFLRSLWFQIPTKIWFQYGIRNIRRGYNIGINTAIREDVFKLSKEESVTYVEEILQGWNSRSKIWKLWWRFKIQVAMYGL